MRAENLVKYKDESVPHPVLIRNVVLIAAAKLSDDIKYLLLNPLVHHLGAVVMLYKRSSWNGPCAHKEILPQTEELIAKVFKF